MRSPRPSRIHRGARPRRRLDVLGAWARAIGRVPQPTSPTGAAEDAPRGRLGLLAIALLVAVPMIMTAVALLPELTLPVPNLNDDAFQFLLVQRIDDALRTGANPLDFWVPQLELGFPQAFYYQNLPHLVVVLLDRLTLGTVDLFTTFNAVRWILFVALPLTVYWSLRRMGFSAVAAAAAAAASPLISGAFRYGFEYDSYVWRGFGMYTQLWAVHLSFIALACVHRVLERGTGYVLAIVAVSMLVLSHFVYAYMMAITLVLIVVVGARRATIVSRALRLGIVGLVVLVVTAYQWLPFITSSQFLSASPYLQPYKYDSFGAPAILGWLFSGDLFDHGRMPVLTLLLGLGVVWAVVQRSRLTMLVLAGFVVWLVLYFGRPTLGPLFDLFPLHDGLLIHRFIGEMELFAIPLIGLGGALVWRLVLRTGLAARLWLAGEARHLAAVVVLVVLLAPALLERAEFYAGNTEHMRNTAAALQADSGLQAVLTRLESLPDGGRVYAGLRGDWGKQLAVGSLNVRDVLTFHQIPVAGPPYQGLSLNSDLVWSFRDQEASQYDLFDARYVITPATLPVPGFYSLIERSGKYALYRVPTTGAAEYVAIASRRSATTQDGLFFANLDWLRSDQPAARRFIHWDYLTPSGPADLSDGCPGGATLFEDDASDSIVVVVDCPVAADLVLKVSYHPDWTVTVDHQPVPTFMASPSFVGIHLPAGKHQVEAVYRAAPTKMPLLIAGLGLLVLAFLFRRRLDWLPSRLDRLVRREGGVEAAPPGPPLAVAPPPDVPAPAPPRRDLRRSPPAARPVAAAWRARLAQGERTIIVLALLSALLYAIVVTTQTRLYLDGSWASVAPAPASIANLELTVYLLANGGLLALYAVLVRHCARHRVDGAGRVILFVAPVTFMLAFLVARPVLSVDALSYLAHGATGLALGGGDAYSSAPQALLQTTYGQELLALGWNPPPAPSPYGPLWTIIENLVVRLLSIGTALTAFKAIALLSALGCAALVWRILGLLRPQSQVAGTILFLWNPVVIGELAGEGHNDGLMIFATLLGVYATLRLWPARGILLTALGGLVKYLPLMLMPAQLVFLWRSGIGNRRLVRQVALGAIVSIGVSAVLFAPFWGPQTFTALGRSSLGGAWPLWPSIGGLLQGLLQAVAPAFDPVWAIRLLIDLPFAAFVLYQSSRARDAEQLVRISATVVIVYVLVVSPIYWAWYCLLPIGLLALGPVRRALPMILTLSIGSRLIAPLAMLPSDRPFPQAWALITLGVVLLTIGAFVADRFEVLAWIGAILRPKPVR